MDKKTFKQLCKDKGLTGVELQNLLNYAKRQGVADDLIDWEGELDSTLCYKEMLDQLKALLPNTSFSDNIQNELDKVVEQARQSRFEERQKKEEQLLEAILTRKEEINTEVWKQRTTIIKSINEWNIHSEGYSWLVIFWLMRTGNFNVQLVGHKGTGKSRSISDLPKELGLEAHNIHGHRSPLQFYSEVFEHKDDLIAVEEAEVIQANNQIKDMFRTGFYFPHIFEWKSTKKLPAGVDDHFKFSGSVCFGTNGLQSLDNPHTDASYDRFFICNIRHTKKQIREKQRHKREYQPDSNMMKLVGDRIRLIQNNETNVKLTADDYKLIDLILDEAYADSEGNIKDVYSKKVSMRDLDKLEKLTYCTKLLFGSLGDKRIVDLLKTIFFSLGAEPRNHIVHMVRTNDNMKYKELAEHIAHNENCSLRTAYRRMIDLIEDGKLKKEGTYIRAVI